MLGAYIFIIVKSFSWIDFFYHYAAIPLLGIYSKKTTILKDTCTPLFTIARAWNQFRCPLTDKWIKKLWYICAIEYYSAV